MIHLKRAYDEPSSSDGKRILVERLWPRGVTKDKAQLDLWLKEIAPTTELRKWYNHDPALWEEFQHRYWQELDHNPDAVTKLRQEVKQGTVTLIYAAHDQEHNGALALKAYLEKKS